MWRLNVEGLSAVSLNHTYTTHVLNTPSLKLHVKYIKLSSDQGGLTIVIDFD